jgi:SulP family sulfate permease
MSVVGERGVRPDDVVVPEPSAASSAQHLESRVPPRSALVADTVAGASVALVLIPQSLAYAIVAGLPPDRGLLAALLPPLVGGLLASSRYLQTGPTAVTSLLTLGALAAVAVPGSAAYVALAAILALLVGAIRMAIGLLRLGDVAYAMSRTVVVGFTSAAAILIVASQIPAALGVQGAATNPLVSAIVAIANPGAWSAAAIAVAAAVVVTVLGLRRLSPLVPGALIALVGATALSAQLDYPAAVLGPIDFDLGLDLDIDPAAIPSLLVPGLVIALIGFAEPAAIARRYAAVDRDAWNPNREFIAQGAANVAAGLSGGFPVGGSFSRTALSHLAGARSRRASAFTSLTVLALIPFIGVLASLPIAALSGVVIAAVISLVDLVGLGSYWRISRPQFAVALLTFGATLVLAPHVEYGIVLGVIAAVSTHLWRESRIEVDAWVDDVSLHLRPRGVLFFGSVHRLEPLMLDRLSHHADVGRIVVHLDGIGRLDVNGALALRQLLEDARLGGLQVEIRDVPAQVLPLLTRVTRGWLPIVRSGDGHRAGRSSGGHRGTLEHGRRKGHRKHPVR